jgi:GNAT superfamily N-acetyltransferase
MSGFWRAMREEDLAQVVRLADMIHVDFPERPEVFAERLALFPAGARIWERDGAAVGYTLAHPWRGAPPHLDTLLGRLPDAPDHLHIHDVALAPAARGAGAAALAVERLEREARLISLGALRLVAVSGSATLWERLGFQALGPACADYGEEAVAMSKVFGSNCATT